MSAFNTVTSVAPNPLTSSHVYPSFSQDVPVSFSMSIPVTPATEVVLSTTSHQQSVLRKSSQACEPCRRAKKKCSGEHPCKRCFRSGLVESCRYELNLYDTLVVDRSGFKLACVACRKSHTACSNERPCLRCMELKIECVEHKSSRSSAKDLEKSKSSKSSSDSGRIVSPKRMTIPVVYVDVIVDSSHEYCSKVYSLVSSVPPSRFLNLLQGSFIPCAIAFSVFLNLLPKSVSVQLCSDIQQTCITQCKSEIDALGVARRIESIRLFFQDFRLPIFLTENSKQPREAQAYKDLQIVLDRIAALPELRFTGCNRVPAQLLLYRSSLSSTFVDSCFYFNDEFSNLWGYSKQELEQFCLQDVTKTVEMLDPDLRRLNFLSKLIYHEDWAMLTAIAVNRFVDPQWNPARVRIVPKNGEAIECCTKLMTYFPEDGSMVDVMMFVPLSSCFEKCLKNKS